MADRISMYSYVTMCFKKIQNQLKELLRLATTSYSLNITTKRRNVGLQHDFYQESNLLYSHHTIQSLSFDRMIESFVQLTPF